MKSSVSRGNRQMIICKVLSTPSPHQFQSCVKTLFFISSSPPLRLLDTGAEWITSCQITAVFCHSYTNWHNHSTKQSLEDLRLSHSCLNIQSPKPSLLQITGCRAQFISSTELVQETRHSKLQHLLCANDRQAGHVYLGQNPRDREESIKENGFKESAKLLNQALLHHSKWETKIREQGKCKTVSSCPDKGKRQENRNHMGKDPFLKSTLMQTQLCAATRTLSMRFACHYLLGTHVMNKAPPSVQQVYEDLQRTLSVACLQKSKWCCWLARF